MIPSLNVLDLAHDAIGTQSVIYRRFVGSRELSNGVTVNEYAPDEILSRCSIFPVKKSTEYQAGVANSKRAIEILASSRFFGVERGKSGDQIEWRGVKFVVVETSDFVDIDRWSRVLCEESR